MLFGKKNKERDSSGEKNTEKATFWGASDRMVCCKGIDCEVDEFNVTRNSKLADGGYVATLEISAPGESQGLYLHCFYSGHWSFAVSPSSDESDDLTDLKIERSWGDTNNLSETLVVHCPVGARVDAVDRIESCS